MMCGRCGGEMKKDYSSGGNVKCVKCGMVDFCPSNSEEVGECE